MGARRVIAMDVLQGTIATHYPHSSYGFRPVCRVIPSPFLAIPCMHAYNQLVISLLLGRLAMSKQMGATHTVQVDLDNLQHV
jgi:hypothetical protein